MKHLDMFLSGDFWSAFDSVKRISQRSSTDQVGVTIQSVENLYTYVTNKKEKNAPKQMSTDFNCYFKAELIYGENPLCSAVYSNVYEVKNDYLFCLFNKNDVGSEIVTRDNNDTCLGTVNVKLVTHTHDLVSGDQQYFLWYSDPNPIAMCCNAVDSKLKLHVEYPALKLPMKMDTFITKKKEMQVELEPESMHQLSAEETVSFNKLLDVDAMAILSTAETRSMWDNRYYVLKTKPRALPRICMAVNYTQPSDVHELHRLLTKWPLLSPHEAIELLDFRYPDPEIRAYALRCIDTMDDDQLVMYLPQLVQALKFELHHHSALATFLLRRALRNRRRIGHNLFWFLRAEIHDERVTGRYGVLLEAFLLGCGKYKAELLKEVTFQTQLVGIANKVKTLSSQYPSEMALPLNSTFRIKRAVPNTGNVFSSKKKPLLLILENADPLGQPIMVIQKNYE
ncbi:Phosphatidylinositol 3-kinase catalytic subunit gamma [Entamoeba marina]